MKEANVKEVKVQEAKLSLAMLLNPDFIFLLALALLGGVAAGWLLIGAGMLLALLPVGAGFWWLLRRATRRGTQSGAN